VITTPKRAATMNARGLIQLTTDQFLSRSRFVSATACSTDPALPPQTNEDIELYCSPSPTVKQPTDRFNLPK
jgi:hypothetical protein